MWNTRYMSNTCYIYIRQVQTIKQNLFHTTHTSYHSKNENPRKGLGIYDHKSLIVPEDFGDHCLDY